jgi:hypothetical protein
MNPVGSDAFLTTDFAQSFAVLDANPGVPVAPNAAARPSNYTASQHGSIVYQADLNILWVWYQPNSGVVGYWNRIGHFGTLGQFNNTGTVSTSTTNYSVGPTIVSGTVTVPGGRPLLLMWSWDRLDNNYGRSIISYWENNVRIVDKAFYGYTGDITTETYWWLSNPAPVNSLSLTVKLTLAAYNAAPPNGGATSTIGNASLTVIEM